MGDSRGSRSLRQGVRDELAAAGRALTIPEMLQRLLPDMPEKTAEKKIRTAVGYEHDAVVRVGRGTYDLVQRRLNGARFRYRVSPWELKCGLLLVSEDLEFVFAPLWENGRSEEGQPMIEDDDGRRIEAEMTAADGPLPPHMVGPYVRRVAYRLMVGLQPYFESHRLTPADDLVIEVENVRPPRYRLSVEKVGERDDDGVKSVDDDVVDVCYSILNFSKHVFSVDLMRRLVGLYDFRTGVAPHLPMLLLPGDPRFVFVYLEYCLRGHEDSIYREDAEDPEYDEMEVLLRGASELDGTIEDHAVLARQIIHGMIRSGLSGSRGRMDDMSERLLREKRARLKKDSQRMNLMRRICFDRLRLLRGLWPDEPNPGSPEEWLRLIGAGTGDEPE